VPNQACYAVPPVLQIFVNKPTLYFMGMFLCFCRTMPYHKKRKTNRPPRKTTAKEVMKVAVDEVLGGRAAATVAKEFGVDRMTLKRYVKKTLADPSTICQPNYVTKKVFNDGQEKNLGCYLLQASKMNYGLTAMTSRTLAYKYAQAISQPFPESWNKHGRAGKDWLRDFMKRSGNLSLRTPEPTSFSRSTAWNLHTKNEFFTNLREARSRYPYAAQNIYNVDETAVTTVQRPAKVVAGKGTKQVGRITSAERGTLVTACCCINAVGNSIPPFFVYPRVHFKSSMLNGGPPGSVGVGNPSGWMTSNCFIEWMKHFAKCTQCSTDNKVLLRLDNHDSHISYECLHFAKENGITMLSFPPHTTHKLQPLDVAVYGPFKRYYNAACDDFMVTNPRPLTIYDIASIASGAFLRAFTPANITAGFKCTGIEPFNPTVFNDDDEFLAAAVTDRPMPTDQQGISRYMPKFSKKYNYDIYNECLYLIVNGTFQLRYKICYYLMLVGVNIRS